MSSFRRKLDRVLYYATNVGRDIAPQFLFRSRLSTILDGHKQYDPEYLSSRVNYYNKLPRRAAAEEFGATVASISMSHSFYYFDLKEHARYFPRSLRLNYVFGDMIHVPDLPSLVKSRPIGRENANSVLMKLDKFRHFHFPQDALAFSEKQPMAVWRGYLNNSKRAELVRRYHRHPSCDIGHTAASATPDQRKPFMSSADQMKFKYILSVEGNDVATNLKWVMASNSLCFMTTPAYETWFMEGRLEAGKHYVCLRPDFADLDDKIRYFEEHPDEALDIIGNAHSYVRQFLDARREQLLSLLVLYKYFLATGQIEPSDRLLELTARLFSP